MVGHQDTTVALALNDVADKANQSLYLAKNTRYLGVTNNLLRSGGSLKIVCVGDRITAGQTLSVQIKSPRQPATLRQLRRYSTLVDLRLG